jgi:hypothetical protein
MTNAPLNPVPLLQLEDAAVEYVLIGLAGAMLGTTRITRDIDLAYASHYENLERVSSVISRFRPRLKMLGAAEEGVIRLTPAHLRRSRMIEKPTARPAPLYVSGFTVPAASSSSYQPEHYLGVSRCIDIAFVIFACTHQFRCACKRSCGRRRADDLQPNAFRHSGNRCKSPRSHPTVQVVHLRILKPSDIAQRIRNATIVAVRLHRRQGVLALPSKKARYSAVFGSIA